MGCQTEIISLPTRLVLKFCSYRELKLIASAEASGNERRIKKTEARESRPY
jgi:hypothetical protein